MLKTFRVGGERKIQCGELQHPSWSVSFKYDLIIVIITIIIIIIKYVFINVQA
jgi:hypothetical protein